MKKPVSSSSSKTPISAKPAISKAVEAAAKPAKKAAAPKAVKPKAPSAALVPEVTPPVVPAVKVAAPSPAPAPVAKAPIPSSAKKVTVLATIDVGFGNQLFIRGEGAGLSWDKGIALDNVDAGRWQIVLNNATGPVTFKLLVNDLSWSVGENFTAAAGSTVSVLPGF